MRRYGVTLRPSPFPAIAMAWLAVLFIGLWPLAAPAIEVTSESQMEISEQVFWCASDPGTDIAEVAAGHCPFKLATMSDLARGFSAQAFWLRIELHNPEPKEVERWLRVGHPRLQQVSLFEPEQNNIWRRTDTGISVPLALRPAVAANPVLPLRLEAGVNKTLYVRVASQSPIDLTLTLWKQDAYVAAHHSSEMMNVLTVGCLLTVVLFTLVVFVKWRDRVYLYFGATLFFEVALDATYSGLLPAYFWPRSWPFDLRILAPLAGGTFVSITLFARQFIGEVQRYRRYYLALFVSLGILMLAVLWACLVSFGEAVRLIYLAGLSVLLSSVALFFRSWRDGSSAAGYVLASYVMLTLSLLYRLLLAFGGNNFVDMQSVVFSWRILLITPVILVAVIQRSEKLREAERQLAARVQFLAQMSHEFRTPLNVMLGYAELLERNSRRITVQESASAIKRSGRYLLGMIDEMLDHARGEAGKLALNITPVHWADFIKALEQSTTIKLHAHDNLFELRQEGDMPQALLLDERRFRQVLDILLSNANRYTRHGSITLSCTAVPVKSHRSLLTLSVSDTGAGIAPQELAHIFQPFVRGTAGKTSGIDGTGMGLAIAQQLVTLMGGEIGVESQLGKGSRFHFSFECELAEAEAQTEPGRSRGKLRQPRTVLVVDDDSDNCKLLTILLADCGFNVVTAKSGNAARQFLGHKIDLVITDQFMPDGDGWSVLRDWTARPVPVLLLSAAPPQQPHDFPSALDFVSIQLKPVNADALLDAISEALALDWEAAEAESPSDEIKRPPPELLTPLLAMIEAGAVTDIEEWTETFCAQHPEYRAYGAKIAASNLALDFDALRKLAWVA